MIDIDIVRETLQRLNQKTLALLTHARQVLPQADPAFDDWEKMCRGIQRQITEGWVRIAVVGAIKSGKSTLVNSIFKGDYLKRGAGVVTSIVTRIRSGSYLKATLFFKSWDEINADLRQAMALLPGAGLDETAGPFDIRREKDRRLLAKALASLDSEALIAEGARSAGSVLMAAYLKGYDRAATLVGPEPRTTVFEDDQFPRHKDFSGSDALAVYLKDIQLEIKGGELPENVEIADCQGSDSPNPMHLSMIQDYLFKAHLLLYVISSRTGPRRADIRFLAMLKDMGLMEHVLFVINCDISEHDTLADLTHVIDKTAAEIALLRPDPPLFTLSALYSLFTSAPQKMRTREQRRLAEWESENDILGFLKAETDRFQTDLQAKLTRERYTLLLGNHVDRMAVVLKGLSHWSQLHQQARGKDAERFGNVLAKIEFHQQQVKQIEMLLNQTLSGVRQKMKTEAKTDVDRFFDTRAGGVVPQVLGFVRGYDAAPEAYGDKLAAAGFSDLLFLYFQDFKEALDRYISRNINPKILRFVGDAEKKLAASLQSVVRPYENMVQGAVAEYRDAIVQLGLRAGDAPEKKAVPVDMDWRFGTDALQLASVASTMRYSAAIRAEAVFKLGFYTMLRPLNRLFKRFSGDARESRKRALKDGVRRMKQETERSVKQHFLDYRENIKFQYLFKRVDEMSARLQAHLLSCFQSYAVDLSGLKQALNTGRSDQTTILEELASIDAEAADVLKQLRGGGLS